VSLIRFISAVQIIGFILAANAFAVANDPLAQMIKGELQAKIPSAKIELTGPARWVSGTPGAQEISAVRVLGTSSKGEAQIAIRLADGSRAEGFVPFSAWVPARVAVKRILPGETLAQEMFVTQDVNVASGQAYDLRGVILSHSSEVAGLEARQTVLEGTFLTTSAVRKVPDVRKGDAVRIRIQTEGVHLSTIGIAEEPGYIDGRVRVMTQKTKREFIGQLAVGRVVEVKL
jgi:flagella basal body P-ring formation protein FlgA